MYHMTYLAQNGSRRPKCSSPSLIAGNDIWCIPSDYAQYFNLKDHKHIGSIIFFRFSNNYTLVVGTGHHLVSSRAHLYWTCKVRCDGSEITFLDIVIF